MNENEVPRRIDRSRFTPAETAITGAMHAVEVAGAHPHLTEAVTLLGRARDRVADFVDGVPEAPPPPAPPPDKELVALRAERDGLRLANGRLRLKVVEQQATICRQQADAQNTVAGLEAKLVELRTVLASYKANEAQREEALATRMREDLARAEKNPSAPVAPEG